MNKVKITKEDLEKKMKEDCHDPKFVKFFISEAVFMTELADSMGGLEGFRAHSNCRFAVVKLALKVISSELPKKRKKAEVLLKEMEKHESIIKQMFNLDQ